MATDTGGDVRAALRSWRRRRRSLADERDPLVKRALEEGLTKEEIHQLIGIGRSTIDRIQAATAARGRWEAS